MTQFEIKQNAMLVLTSLNNILEAELTRHINEFKHEKKKIYNNLVDACNNFVITVNADKEIKEVLNEAIEQFSGYFHELIADLNNATYNKNQLSITVGLCYTISETYSKYVEMDNFKYKIVFDRIAKVCKLFAKINQNSYDSYRYSEDFKTFAFSLIEKNEYTFEINKL